MDKIAIDIVGPLPMSNHGNEYIMVVTDYFTKWVEAYPLENHTAQAVADKLVTEFISRFGVPNSIHTDQGREFESVLFGCMCDLLDIDKTRTTPYRPQSDGLVERFNQTLQQLLAILVNEQRSDWDDHIPFVLMAYRASQQQSTKCSPNLLMFGREVTLPIGMVVGPAPGETKRDCPSQYVEWLREGLERAFEFVRENVKSSASRQKKSYDRNCKRRNYEVGSLVWRWYPPKANQKLGTGWTGPYQVMAVKGYSSVLLQYKEGCPSVWVHKDDLKQYRGVEKA